MILLLFFIYAAEYLPARLSGTYDSKSTWELCQMPEYPSENASFLRNGDIVSVGIDLPDKTFAEDLAIVVTTKSGEILLNLCGSGFPQHLPIKAGSRVLITRGEGKSLFHSTAILKTPPADSTLNIEFPQKVTVRERREHMREDVMIPVHYYLPTSQNMNIVISEWEGLKSCQGECGKKIQPLLSDRYSRVNLSGSGLRFRIRDCLSYGTLLHLKIELEEPEHIHAVGSIVRTKELIPEMSHMEYYSTSMSFRMIDISDRLKLIRYILDKQHGKFDTTPEQL